jgi:8-oxo-dGTP pyrophosphatase MutT (NUDIX family)
VGETRDVTDDRLREDLSESGDQPEMFALSSVVYAEREGKILLLKRSADSGMPGEWFLPGGAVNPGETPQEAARRELKEESGLEIAEGLEMVGCYPFRMYGHNILQLSFRAPVSGEVRISDEHEGARWVDAAEMREALTDEAIEAIARGNENIRSMVLHIRDDLDAYLRRIGRS